MSETWYKHSEKGRDSTEIAQKAIEQRNKEDEVMYEFRVAAFALIESWGKPLKESLSDDQIDQLARQLVIIYRKNVEVFKADVEAELPLTALAIIAILIKRKLTPEEENGIIDKFFEKIG